MMMSRQKHLRFALTLACVYLLAAGQTVANIIVNGDFESGNVGFTSDYVFNPLSSPVNILGQQEYVITVNPSLNHNQGTSYGDNTTGTGNMMMVNGATTPDQVVWSQTISVTANTDYDFSVFVSTWVAGFSQLAELDFLVNDISIGTFDAPSTDSVWREFSTTFNTGASPSIVVDIIDLNTAGAGNDFALDDISLVASTVPEPTTLALITLGLAGLGFTRRRRLNVAENL